MAQVLVQVTARRMNSQVLPFEEANCGQIPDQYNGVEHPRLLKLLQQMAVAAKEVCWYTRNARVSCYLPRSKNSEYSFP